MTVLKADVLVIGGGTVGAAVAYGLARRNVRVVLLDGEDRDFRAATANFGLVWQHGKGMNMPAYQQLTHNSVGLWPDFSAELADATAIDLQLEQNGGLAMCVGEAEFEQRSATLKRLHNQFGSTEPDWQMLDRDELSRLMPKARLGPEVTGASFGRRDGHVNPLRLLAALHTGIVRLGGEVRGGCTVRLLKKDGDAFTAEFALGTASAARVVIAAGLGTKALASQVGLEIPVRPQRGQILVTERIEQFLPLPTLDIRQTREGTVMIGATHEEVGFDSSTSLTAAASLSHDAIRRLPALGEVRLVRQWAGLRIMTPDGHPIYAESVTHKGAFVAQCHSGVTLAATHATLLAKAIEAGHLTPSFDAFHQRRFDVPQIA
jgi:glycine/D-amino acid oxidase-like deaminating enzyme